MVATHKPEPAERPCEPETCLTLRRIVLVEQPAQRRPQVILLALQPHEPGALVALAQLGLGPLGQREKVVGVGEAGCLQLARGDELLPGVLAHRL